MLCVGANLGYLLQLKSHPESNRDGFSVFRSIAPILFGGNLIIPSIHETLKLKSTSSRLVEELSKNRIS